MSIGSFIFCDRCNPQAIRNIPFPGEQRRNADGRSWFDGSSEDAQKEGWLVDRDYHICPRCNDFGTIKPSTKNSPRFTIVPGSRESNNS
jgi:hypothetical protein